MKRFFSSWQGLAATIWKYICITAEVSWALIQICFTPIRLVWIKYLRRVVSSWQGLACGIAALALYIASPILIRRYVDPTAGTFDGGFLQWIALATVAYFWGLFVIWFGWQKAFPSMDKWADVHLKQAFDGLPNWAKFVAVQSTFILMAVFWLLILKSIPV